MEQSQRAMETKNLRHNDDQDFSTISIAIPGSILNNAQSAELRTYLAGQIARSLAIFKIDEIIVYDDSEQQKSSTAENTNGQIRDCCNQFAKILQYLECPQYLRKYFFPIHNDLKYSGLLNPLDAQHHLRQQSDFMYREGVIVKKSNISSESSFVDCGLKSLVKVDQKLTPGVRVTVKLDVEIGKNNIRTAKIVSPKEPRQTGIYWGYNVRRVNSISQIFSGSQFENGYDLCIGTSDRGQSIQEIQNESLKFNHALIVFGGVLGIDQALKNDDQLKIGDPALLFDFYLNTIPDQGSRTIRTEEAVLISLAGLNLKMQPLRKSPKFEFSDSIAHSEDTGAKNLFQKKFKRARTQHSTK